MNMHKGTRQCKLSKDERKQLFTWLKSKGWTRQQIVEILANGTTAFSLYQDYVQSEAEKAFWSTVKVGDLNQSEEPSHNLERQVHSTEELKKVRRDLMKKKSAQSKATKKTTTIQLDPDQLEKLQALAEREERTVSALIRLAIRRYLEEFYE